MLIHVNDAVTLQGARALRQPLIIPYGIHQEYELQIVTGHGNSPVDVESRGCVKWTLTITPSPENPTKVLAYAVFAENIATGSYLRFDLAATSVEMYKHVAGNPATPAVLQLQGFTEEDAPATLVITLPVALVTTAQQRLPVDLSTALMQELQLAVSVVGAAQREISKYAGESTDAADRAELAAINAHASEVNAEHSATAAGISAGNARESELAAETAQSKAELAQGKAEDAQAAAETAQSKAEAAQTAAETAQGKAEDAQDAAEAAQTAAETAQGKAEDAQTAAEAAQTAAETAQGKAEDAQDAAEAAQTAAETAQSKAETAQSKAEDAQAAAETAQGKAEDAQTAAETAQGKAEDAQTAAETAQTAAETAQGKAEDAQTAAETAQQAAETAQGKAEDAQDAAEAAQTAAETAQGKAEDAQTAAETAQGKAEDAQQAAETAQGLAETAQGKAEDAQTAAETAQTAAETAQGKAEDAQDAAEAAQDAAETAQTAAEGSEDAAAASAKLSESWAKGDTGVRDDEDTNNAKYWADQSRSFSPITKADKVTGGDTEGMVAGLDAEGNLTNTEVPADNVAQKDGYYAEEGLGARTAENLIDPKATPTNRKFGFDTACGDVSISDDGNAIVDTFMGTTQVMNQLVPPVAEVMSSGNGQVQTQYAVAGNARKLIVTAPVTCVVNQEIANGDFSDGATGWRGNFATVSAADHVLSVTASATRGDIGVVTDVNIVANHVYLMRFKLLTPTNVTNCRVYNNANMGVKFLDNLQCPANTWTTLTGRFTAGAKSGTIIIMPAGSDGHAIGDVYQLKEVELVDLTRYFNNASSLISAVQTWDDLAAYDSEYSGFMPHEPGRVKAGTPSVSVNGGASMTAPQPLFRGSTGLLHADTYDAVSGKTTKRFASVDLGTLIWNKGNSSSGEYFCTPANIPAGKFQTSAGLICSAYVYTGATWINMVDMTIANNTSNIYIRDSRFASKTAAEFKTAMSGVTLYYELGTPTTEEDTAHVIALEQGSNTIEQVAGHGTANLAVQYNATEYDIPLYNKNVYIYRNAEGKDTRLAPTANTTRHVVCGVDKLIDLTHWFGLFNEPSIDGFYKLYPTWKAADIPYIRGQILNYKGTGVRTIGFNAYNHATGTAKLLGGNKYQICGTYDSVSYVTYYGATEELELDAAGIFTPRQSGTLTVVGGNGTDTCVHLCWSGYKNFGEPDYEWQPYTEIDTLFPVSTYFPDGMNGIVIKGSATATPVVYRDELSASSYIQRLGVKVFDGTETWGKHTTSAGQTFWIMGLAGKTLSPTFYDARDMMWSAFKPTHQVGGGYYGAMVDGSFMGHYSNGNQYISLYIESCTTLAEIQEATKGTVIVFLKQTAYAGTLQPTAIPEKLNLIYPVNDFGTEESLPVNPLMLESTELDAMVKYSLDFTRTVVHYSEIESDVEGLVKEKNNLARQDGYYASKRFGAYSAEQLIDPRATPERRDFGFDTAAGTVSIADDGNAVIDTMYGTLQMANQLVKPFEDTALPMEGNAGSSGTAVAGPVRNIEFKGFSYVFNQLIRNGNFETDIDGWSVLDPSCDTLTRGDMQGVVCGQYSCTAVSGDRNGLSVSADIRAGHKYAVCLDLRISKKSIHVNVSLGGVSAMHGTISGSDAPYTWVLFVTAETDGSAVDVYFTDISAGTNVYITSAMLVDITQLCNNGDNAEMFVSKEALWSACPEYMAYSAYNPGEVRGTRTKAHVNTHVRNQHILSGNFDPADSGTLYRLPGESSATSVISGNVLTMTSVVTTTSKPLVFSTDTSVMHHVYMLHWYSQQQVASPDYATLVGQYNYWPVDKWTQSIGTVGTSGLGAWESKTLRFVKNQAESDTYTMRLYHFVQGCTFSVKQVQLVDLTEMFDGNQELIDSIQTWADLVAYDPAYAGYVEHGSSVVVDEGRTGGYVQCPRELHGIDGYADLADVATGVSWTCIDSVDLGSLSYTRGVSSTNGYTYFMAQISGRPTSSNNRIICDSFIRLNGQAAPAAADAFYGLMYSPSYSGNSNNNKNVYFYADYPDADSFKAAYAGKRLYYWRAETKSTATGSAMDITQGAFRAFMGGSTLASLTVKYPSSVYPMTLTQNIRYIHRNALGVDALIAPTAQAGTTITVTGGVDKVIDLSRWFGRSLEPTIEQFYKLYPLWKGYDIPYIEGQVLNYKGTGVATVGFNCYDHSAGTAELLGGNQYQICGTYASVAYTDIWGVAEELELDAQGRFTPANDGTLTVTGGNATDTCVHLCWSGYKNYGEAEYKWEPYVRNVHGIPVTDMFTDGMNALFGYYDELTESGCVQRIKKHVFDGTESFTVNAAGAGTTRYYYSYTVTDRLVPASSAANFNFACNFMTGNNNFNAWANGATGGVMWEGGNNGSIRLLPPDDWGVNSHADVAGFKAKLKELYDNGTPLVLYYISKTPVTTTFQMPLNLTYPVNDFGTEQSLPVNTTQLVSTDLKADIRYNTDFMRMNVQLNERMDTIKSLVDQERKGEIMKTDSTAPDATVGYAYNLVDRAAAGVLRELTYDTAGGTQDITDGVALGKKIEGTTLVMNQLVAPDNENTVDAVDGQVAVTDAVGGQVKHLVVSGDTVVVNQLVHEYVEKAESGTGRIWIKDAFEKEAKGLKVTAPRSVVMNQQIRNGNFNDGLNGWTTNVFTATVENGVVTASLETEAGNAYVLSTGSDSSAIAGHKYLCAIDIYTDFTVAGRPGKAIAINGGYRHYGKLNIDDAYVGQWHRYSCVQVGRDTGQNYGTSFVVFSAAQTEPFSAKVRNVQRVDLTKYFNGNTTLIDSIQTWDDLVAYDPSFAAYVPYNTGTVKGVTPAFTLNGAAQPFATAPQEMFGVPGAGDWYDVTGGRFHKKTVVVDLSTLNWVYQSIGAWAALLPSTVEPPDSAQDINTVCDSYTVVPSAQPSKPTGWLFTNWIAANQAVGVQVQAANDTDRPTGLLLCEAAEDTVTDVTPVAFNLVSHDNTIFQTSGDLHAGIEATYDGLNQTIALDPAHTYAFNHQYVEDSIITGEASIDCVGTEDNLVDLTKLYNGDSTRIAAIHSWASLSSRIHMYRDWLPYNPGEIVNLAATIRVYQHEHAYGVIYDPSQSSPACQRVELNDGVITEVEEFTSLPAHDFKRCVMDDLATRHVNYYLDPLDSTKKADGTPSVLTGADGDVMVEIPITHWYIDEDYNGEGKVLWLVSDAPFTGSEIHPYFYVSPNGDEPRIQYVGAYKAIVCDAEGNALNTVEGAVTQNTGEASTRLARSVAGALSWTSVSMSDIRAAAERNGGCQTNTLFYQFLLLMIIIDKASLNTQDVSLGYTNAKNNTSYWCWRKSGRTNYGNGTGETFAVSGTQDEDTFCSGRINSNTVYRDTLKDANGRYAWTAAGRSLRQGGFTASPTPENGDAVYADSTGDDIVGTITGLSFTAENLRVIQFQYRGIENLWGETYTFEDGFQRYQKIIISAIAVNRVTYQVNHLKDGLGHKTAWTDANTSTTVWTIGDFPTYNATVYADAECTVDTGYVVGANTSVRVDCEAWLTRASSEYTSAGQHTANAKTYALYRKYWPADGYVKRFDARTFFVVTIGGSQTTFLCDSYLSGYSTNTCLSQLGGNASSMNSSGLGYRRLDGALTASFSYTSGRISC